MIGCVWCSSPKLDLVELVTLFVAMDDPRPIAAFHILEMLSVDNAAIGNYSIWIILIGPILDNYSNWSMLQASRHNDWLDFFNSLTNNKIPRGWIDTIL